MAAGSESGNVFVSDTPKKRNPVKRELFVAGILLLLGLLVLPIAIYLVGNAIFAEGYGGGKLGDFARNFGKELLGGSLPMWFLVLSPFLTISLFRLAIWGVRKTPKLTEKT